jgi:hypothetical protein
VIGFDPDPHFAVTGILTQQAADQLMQLRDPGSALGSRYLASTVAAPSITSAAPTRAVLLTLPGDGLWLTGAYYLVP